MRKRLRAAGFLAAGLLLAAAAGYAYAEATCRFPATEFACHLAKVEKVMDERGVAAAMEYADQEVLPRAGYAYLHLVLHLVGERAYAEEGGDLAAAMRYLAPYEGYAETATNLSGFDGFVHGAFSSHFLASGRPEEYPALMKEICGGGLSVPAVTDDEFACHHAVGHALVHASANRADPALAACSAASGEAARDACRYGAFMELAYLYLPGYHEGAPRPDSQGASLAATCARMDQSLAPSCEYFVGQSYLSAHKDDPAGAFAACASLRDGGPCAERLARLAVASGLAKEKEARAYCAEHAGALAGACTNAAVASLFMEYAPGGRYHRLLDL